MRVTTFIGTRPEIIRLSRVISALDRDLDHILVHTGQNYDYELNEIFFGDLEVRKPDHFLEAAGGTAAETIANVIRKGDDLLAEVRPDAVLLLGDTNSCLVAIAAKRRKVPVFHMEAGNRCFDERVPEEINRRIVDHISDINMPYSSISREYLLREGFPPDRIVKTGSPMQEILSYYRPKIDASDVLTRLGLTPGKYFVVSCHREENVDYASHLQDLLFMLNYLASEYGYPVIVSTHPRTRKRLAGTDVLLRPEVRLEAPFGYCDYVKLQLHAKATLSDSGTISEESSILGSPALNLREAHERPEAMEEAAVMMTGFDLRRVKEALRILDQSPMGRGRIVGDYDVPNVSDKVVRVIVSYVNYINQRVWRKPLDAQECI